MGRVVVMMDAVVAGSDAVATTAITSKFITTGRDELSLIFGAGISSGVQTGLIKIDRDSRLSKITSQAKEPQPEANSSFVLRMGSCH